MAVFVALRTLTDREARVAHTHGHVTHGDFRKTKLAGFIGEGFETQRVDGHAGVRNVGAARGIEDAAFDRAGAGQRACGVGGGNRKGEPDGKEAQGGSSISWVAAGRPVGCQLHR